MLSIFSTEEMYDDAAYEEWRTGAMEANPGWEPDRQDYYEACWEYLEDEKSNLDKEVQGVIVGMASLGLWNGRFPAAMLCGSNIADILKRYEGDDPSWYSDGKDIRAEMPHHDGTNTVLYRIAKDEDTARRLMEKIAYEGMTEEQFIEKTVSLHPAVAAVYGWPA